MRALDLCQEPRAWGPCGRWLRRPLPSSPAACKTTDKRDPGVGQLRLRELGVPAVDRLLRVVKEKHGATTAKGARSVMSGMVGMAMRHGAMTTNPTRDVAPISVQKKIARALTPGETEHLVKMIRSGK